MTTLQEGVNVLKNDHDNGASVLAHTSLNLLVTLIRETQNPYIAEHLFEQICSYGFALKSARPSMDAAIGGALIAALENVKKRWDDEFGQAWPSGGCRGSMMKDSAIVAVEQCIEERRKTFVRLTEAFTVWTRGKSVELGVRRVSILTLSYSSTMKACLVAALKDIPELEIDLRIMESRPRFEGAFLGLAVLKDIGSQNAERLSVRIESDASVALLSRDVDIVLLGADRISRSGCVSNKTGSLAAVLCAKALSPAAQVVVVSERDKIVSDVDLKGHAEEGNDNSEIRAAWGEKWEALGNDLEAREKHAILTKNVYFETVEGTFVDSYICESGILSREDVEQLSTERAVKEKDIFGAFHELAHDS